MLVSVVCFILAISFPHSHSQTLEDANRLHKYLFNSSNYNIDVRPILNQSEAIQVLITHYLVTIENVDMSRGLIETTGYLQLTWKDDILIWDPSLFGNIQATNLPEGTYWRPGITLYGLVEENRDFFRAENTVGFLYHNGSVHIFITSNIKTLCQMDTFLFPFDSHSCIFDFFSFKHSFGQLNLQTTPEFIVKSFYRENVEWEVVENSSKTFNVSGIASSTSLGGIETKLVIKRRPAFVILHKLVPVSLLVCLSLFTRFVPLDSGERLSYSVTLFLAFAFLMDTMVQGLPINSLAISISSFALVFVNTINSLTVVFSVICVKLASLDTATVNIPSVLKKLVSWKRNSNNRIATEVRKDIDNATARNSGCGKLAKSPIENDTSTAALQSKGKDLTNAKLENTSWPDVANVIDDLYFRGFLVTVVLMTIAGVVIFWTKGAFS